MSITDLKESIENAIHGTRTHKETEELADVLDAMARVAARSLTRWPAEGQLSLTRWN